MKRNLLFLMALPLMMSCSQTYYYQVFQTKSDNVKNNVNHLEYQNEDCTVVYNLWSINGNPGFVIYNNSDKNIFIDLNQTQFIRNEAAYDYFLNREYQSGSSISIGSAVSGSFQKSYSGSYSESSSKSYVLLENLYSNSSSATASAATAASKSVTTSSGITNSKSVTYKEKDIVCISPHSGKYFSEYFIANTPYSDCNMKSRPEGTDKYKYNKKLTFEEEYSPLRFSNAIAYRVEGEETCKFIRNSFYVESIEILTEKEMYIYREKTDPCKEGNKGKVVSKSKALENPAGYKIENQYYSPDRFYIQY